MKRNNIEFATREKNRLRECHFGHRYGVYGEHLSYFGGLRIPICSRQKEEQFINTITKALANVYGLNPPKQKQVQKRN